MQFEGYKNSLFFKYAIEIERTRSITKAAENLYMAQPNLSKAVKEMEETIGFFVFERNSKGVFPTQKGLRFLDHARKILDEMEQINKLTDTEDPERQDFSISIPRGSYIAEGFTRFALELDFEKEISVNIQETNSVRTIDDVIGNKFNLGIIRYQTMYENYYFDYLTNKHLDHDQIWEFEYLALMSKNHPLAMDDEVQFAKLHSYIEIIHGDTAVPYLKGYAFTSLDKKFVDKIFESRNEVSLKRYT
ncbi:MAG: LysR family transcriptional regulator [Treponema sp.]|jgi:DNA-binding transcriptional LysR family regulator|nr:LysR family transcriptional regulator [Treponema sp.]